MKSSPKYILTHNRRQSWLQTTM